MILCVCPNPSVDKYVWINSFLLGGANRATNEKPYPGGKGIHVAFALKELGEEVCVLGFWGGPAGEWIKEQCKKNEIQCYGPETESWTRTCITFKSKGDFNDTELLGAGPRVNSQLLNNFFESFRQLISKIDCITMSGSWPEGAPDNAYAQLIQVANAKKKKTFLDCSGIQIKNALNENPFTIHLNEKEAKLLFPEESLEQSVKSLSQNCERVAVTAGEEGLFYGIDHKVLHAKCEIENIYSAVGSGDCLLAGLAYSFQNKMDPEDSAGFAVACGAANCLREDLGMLYKSDVKRLVINAQVVEMF